MARHRRRPTALLVGGLAVALILCGGLFTVGSRVMQAAPGASLATRGAKRSAKKSTHEAAPVASMDSLAEVDAASDVKRTAEELASACVHDASSAARVECLGVIQPLVRTQVRSGYNAEGLGQDGKGMVAALSAASTIDDRAARADLVIEDVAGPGTFVGLHLSSTNTTLEPDFGSRSGLGHTRVVVEADGGEVMSVDVLDWCGARQEGPRLWTQDAQRWLSSGCYVALFVPFSVRGRVYLMNATFNAVYHNVHTNLLPPQLPVKKGTLKKFGAMAGSIASDDGLIAPPSRDPVLEAVEGADDARAALAEAQQRVAQGLPPQPFPVVGVLRSGMVAATLASIVGKLRGGFAHDSVALAEDAAGEPRALVVAPRRATDVVSASGCGGVIRLLELDIRGASGFAGLHAVRIQAWWDGGDASGAPQVNTSVGMLAMIDESAPAYSMQSLYVYSKPTEDGIHLRLFAPAPFRTSATVRVVNEQAATSLRVVASAYVAAAYPLNTRAGHLFIVDKTSAPGETVPAKKPLHILERPEGSGPGHLAGLVLHQLHSAGAVSAQRRLGAAGPRRHWGDTWGADGDANIYVDGMRVPSYMGSGARAFFGYGKTFTPEEGSMVRGMSVQPRSWTGGLGQTIARQDPSTFRAFFWFIPNSLMRWHTSVAFDFDHGDGKLHRLNSLQAEMEYAVIYYADGFLEGSGRKDHGLSSGAWMGAEASVFTPEPTPGSVFVANKSVVPAEVTGKFYPHHFDHAEQKDGWVVKGDVAFEVTVPTSNEGVVLQRTYDASFPNQAASVRVDGKFVGVWMDAGANSYFKLGQSQFLVPPSATKGKAVLNIRLWNMATTAPDELDADQLCEPMSLEAYRGQCHPPNVPVEWEPSGTPGFHGRNIPAARSHFTLHDLRVYYVAE